MLVDVNGSVADIEKAFHLNLGLYLHPAEQREFYAPDAEPSVDTSVPVLHVSGLDNFVQPHPASLHPIAPSGSNPVPAGGSGTGGTYQGKDFRGAYARGVTLTGVGQSVGLLEFDGFFTNDITTYAQNAGLPNVPIATVLTDNADGSAGSANREVALDIEMAISMAPGLSQVIVYEADASGLPDDILNRMATDNVAKQLSASWTFDTDATTSQILMQFAAQGQTYFNASGDDGSFQEHRGVCRRKIPMRRSSGVPR
jgi:subtilase family serine protease